MRTSLVLLAAAASLAWVPPASAQRARRARPVIAHTDQRLPPPVIMVERNGRATPIELRAVDARVTIVGHLAETSLTMTFHNPNDRAMEGDLYFPLPAGATVSKYALDINGQLVDGVVVPKDKARQVFEAEVRKGIDPGLVEWTRGNVFKTRIFPLPARGQRTVRVGYVSDVDPGNPASYRLPLGFRDPVGTFALEVQVVQAPAAPVVVRGGPRGLAFRGADHRWVASARVNNARLTDDLVISLPRLDDRPVYVERDPDGKTYFAIRHDVTAPPMTAPRANPRRIALYWDASLSRAPTTPDVRGRRDAEISTIAAYLASLGARPVTVDLVVIRDRAAAPRRFALPGRRDALLAALRTMDYDGGSQLGAVGGVRGADLNLVVSDGLSTFGDDKPGAMTGPTYVVDASPRSNRAFLRHLAVTTGGAYFDLSRVSPADAASGIGSQVFSFLRAEVSGADDVYPRLRAPVAGAMTAAGVLRGATATVTLLYGVGDHVTARRTFTVRASDATPGDMLRRYWAQKQVDDLLVFPDDNHAAIVDIGRRHGLVTPGTSLIVLERLDQYVGYEIRPPASLPQMRAQYDQQMRQRVQIARNAENDKLRQVLAMWTEHLSWWRKTYKYPRGFRYGAKADKTLNGGGHGRGAMRRAPGATMARDDDDDDAEADAAAPMEERAREAAPEAKAKKESGGDRGPQPEVTIKEWNPDTPYLRALAAAGASRRFAVYLAQREQYGASPAFFLDAADFFRNAGQGQVALQVLSNLAELELDDPALLRVLGHRLAQLDHLDLSVTTFEQVLALRPEEPQSYRDLALVLARRADRKAARADARRADYTRAMELLARVVMGSWQRFEQIEVIALTELNNAYAKARRLGVTKAPVDARLIQNLDMDVRIVMTWDADLTDMDLHVVEPSDEEAYYGHNRTTIGGMVSRDFTQGYGPEVYAVRRAMRGKYSVKTKFFGSSAAKLIGAVTLQVDVYTNYGRANEQRKSMTLRLTKEKEDFEVGSITF